MTACLIQGFFFQNHNWLTTVHRSEVEGGVGAAIQSGLCRFMYAGIIFPNPENKTELIGETSDRFGESRLFDIVIDCNEARFVKKYDNRNDTINYQFKKNGNLWIGSYSGKATGEGGTKCIITDVPDNLFFPSK